MEIIFQVKQRLNYFLYFIHVNLGLEKRAVQSSGTSRFSCWASYVSFSLARWARAQAGHLPTKLQQKYTTTCPGQAKFENGWPEGQAGIQGFFEPCKTKSITF